jgi:flagellar biosynthetic protein FliR
MNLTELLTTQVVSVMLIFARLGSALMILPGFGEIYVLPRFRLLLGMTLAVVLLPSVEPGLPALPAAGDAALLAMIIAEVVIGLLIGAVARLVMVAVSLAGNLAATQSGLAAAVFFDPHEATQASIGSSFLAIAALTLMMCVDAHHAVLLALVRSYELMPVGEALPLASFGEFALRTLAAATIAGLQMAAPVIIVSLLLNAGLGALGRLAPSVQSLFIAVPVQLTAGLAVLGLGLGPVLYAFLRLLDDTLVRLGP